MTYNAPAITDLGTVRDLTLTNNSNGKQGTLPDGANNNKNGIIGSLTRP